MTGKWFELLPGVRVSNVFCATGVGGGRDPTCQLGAEGSSGGSTKSSERSAFAKMTLKELKKAAKKVSGVEVHVATDRIWNESAGRYDEKPLTTKKQNMLELEVDGVKVRFTDKTAKAALETLKESDNIHPALWKQNKSINFVGEEDPLLVAFPRMRGAVDVAARAGPAGDVAVWEGKSISSPVLAHESAHNLERKADPKVLEEFRKGQKVDAKRTVSNGVTEFGKTSRVEDFAEFVTAYSEIFHMGKDHYNGATRKHLEKRAASLQAVKKMLGD